MTTETDYSQQAGDTLIEVSTGGGHVVVQLLRESGTVTVRKTSDDHNCVFVFIPSSPVPGVTYIEFLREPGQSLTLDVSE